MSRVMQVGDDVKIGGVEFVVFNIINNDKNVGDSPIPVVILSLANNGGYDEYYSLPLAAIQNHVASYK